MPRPLTHGRPGSRVIPTDWAAQHAPVVDNMVESTGCMIRISRTTGRAFDGERTVVTQGVVYDGPAAIMLMTDTSRIVFPAEAQTAVSTYEITLPVDVPPGIDFGQTVVVTTAPGDLALDDGARLVVSRVERGTRRFSRVIQATLNDQDSGHAD